MLFKKIEDFNNQEMIANCIFKPTPENAQFTFKSGKWYIFHLNYFEYDEESKKIFIDSNLKSISETLSDGITDGIVNAFDSEKTISISGLAMIMYLENDMTSNDVYVMPSFGQFVEISSDNHMFTNIHLVSEIKRVNLTFREFVMYLATQYKLFCNNALKVNPFQAYFTENKEKGIKSGQYIL